MAVGGSIVFIPDPLNSGSWTPSVLTKVGGGESPHSDLFTGGAAAFLLPTARSRYAARPVGLLTPNGT